MWDPWSEVCHFADHLGSQTAVGDLLVGLQAGVEADPAEEVHRDPVAFVFHFSPLLSHFQLTSDAMVALAMLWRATHKCPVGHEAHTVVRDVSCSSKTSIG